MRRHMVALNPGEKMEIVSWVWIPTIHSEESGLFFGVGYCYSAAEAAEVIDSIRVRANRRGRIVNVTVRVGGITREGEFIEGLTAE